MKGDNAKTINPAPKAVKEKQRRARADVAITTLEFQLAGAKVLPFKQKVEALRGCLKTLLLCLPHEASAEKKADLVRTLLESPYNDADDFYDMPHVEVDDDIINIRGNFSVRKLAKKLQW